MKDDRIMHISLVQRLPMHNEVIDILTQMAPRISEKTGWPLGFMPVLRDALKFYLPHYKAGTVPKPPQDLAVLTPYQRETMNQHLAAAFANDPFGLRSRFLDLQSLRRHWKIDPDTPDEVTTEQDLTKAFVFWDTDMNHIEPIPMSILKQMTGYSPAALPHEYHKYLRFKRPIAPDALIQTAIADTTDPKDIDEDWARAIVIKAPANTISAALTQENIDYLRAVIFCDPMPPYQHADPFEYYEPTEDAMKKVPKRIQIDMHDHILWMKDHDAKCKPLLDKARAAGILPGEWGWPTSETCLPPQATALQETFRPYLCDNKEEWRTQYPKEKEEEQPCRTPDRNTQPPVFASPVNGLPHQPRPDL